jgi:hypothetical protein
MQMTNRQADGMPSAAQMSAAIALFALFLAPVAAHAQTETWLANPGSGNWNDNNNWSPATAPDGSSTAVFGASSITSINFTSGGQVATMQFNPGAPAYSFTLNAASGQTLDLDINAGIVNITSNQPTFTISAAAANGATLIFNNGSTAANAIIINNSFGTTVFQNTSTAGAATITNNGGGNIALTQQRGRQRHYHQQH